MAGPLPPNNRQPVLASPDAAALAHRAERDGAPLDPYRRHLAHAPPALGKVRMARLAPEDLEYLYASLIDGGSAQ